MQLTGSKNSACPSTPSALPRTKLMSQLLRHLADQDLKDIGVPLGHRRKILAAVSDLGGATPVTTEPAAGSEPKAQDTAERRQVTVMFVALLLLPAAHRQRVLSNHRPNGVAGGCARKTSCRHKNCL